MRVALEEMGHKQPLTPIQTDNTIAEGIANSSMRKKRTKAMDMRFQWMQDRDNQGHFLIYWKRGLNNLADYFSKHHAPTHHRNMHTPYLVNLIHQSLKHDSNFIQGYVPLDFLKPV